MAIDVTCSECGNSFIVWDRVKAPGDEIECPGCGENLEFDFDEDLIECDCEDEDKE